jgi:pimeloyl-ACP methyl ester carboxylesterase
MWHRLAPALAQHFSLIMPDLPGYGWSGAPGSDATHAPYTKRAMANAMIELMEALGHVHFRLAGHDRGGRVAYRLALDHPGRLAKLATLDIVPTWAMWHHMDARLANRAWHWMFLALPAPFPETMIGKDPLFFFDSRVAAGTKIKSLSAFDPRALAHYHAFFSDPVRIHATCEGLSRRPHHRSHSRRGVACHSQEDHLPDAGDLGRRRGHPGGDRRAACDLARMGCGRAGLCDRQRALSRRRGAAGDGRGPDRVFHAALRQGHAQHSRLSSPAKAGSRYLSIRRVT